VGSHTVRGRQGRVGENTKEDEKGRGVPVKRRLCGVGKRKAPPQRDVVLARSAQLKGESPSRGLADKN